MGHGGQQGRDGGEEQARRAPSGCQFGGKEGGEGGREGGGMETAIMQNHINDSQLTACRGKLGEGGEEGGDVCAMRALYCACLVCACHVCLFVCVPDCCISTAGIRAEAGQAGAGHPDRRHVHQR